MIPRLPSRRPTSTFATSRHSRWEFRYWPGLGALTATILLAGQAGNRPEWVASLLAVIVVALAACMAAFVAAGRIGKLLGITGNVVMSRLLGVVLAALAAQYVIDGARAAIGN
jgi:multiple antibiotic resistance protein